MNERQLAAIRAIADLAYTAVAVGIVGYMVRADIRRYLAKKRAEIERVNERVNERAAEVKARAGFHASPAFRDSIIRQEFREDSDA